VPVRPLIPPNRHAPIPGRECPVLCSIRDQLVEHHWLTELIQRELAPYATPRNVDINGLEIVLQAEAGQAMAGDNTRAVERRSMARDIALTVQTGSLRLDGWDRKLRSCLSTAAERPHFAPQIKSFAAINLPCLARFAR
jgi:hypothetical protein